MLLRNLARWKLSLGRVVAPRERQSIQRKDEQVAGILQVVVFHRMQMPAAGLNGDVLLGSDRISHRGALERGAHVEPPQFLERLIVIGHHPTILESREYQAARRVCGARS